MPAVPNYEIKQALAELLTALPDTRWLVLLSQKGQVEGIFPDIGIDEDRISVIGMTILALGERISRELSGGHLHYSLIAGEYGLHIAILLSRTYLLILEARPGVSLDLLFHSLQISVQPLLQILYPQNSLPNLQESPV